MKRLTSSEKRIRNELSAAGKIAIVPPGYLDDFYWIMATASSQSTARDGGDLSVPIDNDQGRWPGTRPVVITNDQMRDHRLELLEPRLFGRWYSNCIVNYNFAAFVGKEMTHPDIGFSPADFFSREIQGNPFVDGKRDGDVVWHFPIADTDNEWFCLCVRNDRNRT